jgi:hypothetical protein
VEAEEAPSKLVEKQPVLDLAREFQIMEESESIVCAQPSAIYKEYLLLVRDQFLAYKAKYQIVL